MSVNLSELLKEYEIERKLLTDRLGVIDETIGTIKKTLADIELEKLSNDLGVTFNHGLQFRVSKDVSHFAKEVRKAGNGYYKGWLVGQTAEIANLTYIESEPFFWCFCDTQGGVSTLSITIPAKLIAPCIKKANGYE